MIMLLIAEFVAGGLAAFYKDKDLVSRQNLQQHTKTICRYSNFSFYLNISAITFLVTIPILTSYGNLVMEVDIPGINVHKSPIYEIVYAFEAFFEAPIAALTYMAHVNMFLIFASIGTFMMKELQTKLNNLSDLNNIEAEVMINNCIKTHITIIKYAEDLEAMFTFVNFVDVFLFCFAICLMLVYSSMDFSAALMLKGLQPMFLQAALLFLLFRFGHDFSDESLNVAHAAYNTDWINRSLQFQKSILFIITRSQKPLQLTVAGFKPLTMEVFVSILRISYSFFSVLQSSL
ncbi:odorant receptor 10 isoform X2 [Eurosta solidaginis]